MLKIGGTVDTPDLRGAQHTQDNYFVWIFHRCILSGLGWPGLGEEAWDAAARPRLPRLQLHERCRQACELNSRLRHKETILQVGDNILGLCPRRPLTCHREIQAEFHILCISEWNKNV